MNTQCRPFIRHMELRDVPHVLAIENTIFDEPWTEDNIMDLMRVNNVVGRVAEVNDVIVGYCFSQLFVSRLLILNMVVHPDFRRTGIGCALMEQLKRSLSEKRRNRICFKVRERNLGGQLFLRAMGFRAVSVLPEFFEDTGEDAYSMHYSLPTTQPTAQPIKVPQTEKRIRFVR